MTEIITLANNILAFNVVGGMRRVMGNVVVVCGLLITVEIISSIGGSFNNGFNNNYIIVDAGGGGDYTHIQEAIDRAKDGDIILVRKGIYHEIINVDKKVIIRGEDMFTTVISPSSKRNGFAILVRAKGAVLENLNITNKGTGMYAQAVKIVSSNVKMINCLVHDVPVGVSIWTSNNLIKNCEFWNCKDEGIVFVGAKYSNCNNNTVIGCSFHNNGDGIELQCAVNNIIVNCKMYNNSHSGIDVLDPYSTNNIILNCVIVGNGYGVLLYPGNKLENCTIEKNKYENLATNGFFGFPAKNKIGTIRSDIKNFFARRILSRFSLHAVSSLLSIFTIYRS